MWIFTIIYSALAKTNMVNMCDPEVEQRIRAVWFTSTRDAFVADGGCVTHFNGGINRLLFSSISGSMRETQR